MSLYVQETDSEMIFVVPEELKLSVSKIANETFGGDLNIRFLSLFKESSLIRSAWDVVQRTENQQVAKEAKEVLRSIEDTVENFFRQSNLDLSYLPGLQAFNVDDGSVLIDWKFNEFRIGFTIEPNPQESGWYLVSTDNLGEITASGYLSNMGLKKLVLWLLNFILAYA